MKVSVSTSFDPESWRKILLACPTSTIYQTIEYSKYEWNSNETIPSQARTLHIVVEEEGKPMGCLLLTRNRFCPFPFLPKMMSEHIKIDEYVSRGGPVIITDDPYKRSEVFDLIIRATKTFAEKEGVSHIRVIPFLHELDQSKARKLGFNIDYYTTIYMDLVPDLGMIWKRLHKHSRTSVRAARKRGVTIVECNDRDDMKEIYYLYLLSRRRTGLPFIPIDRFERYWDIFYPNNMLHLFLAKQGRKVIAGTAALSFNKTIIYDINFSLEEYWYNHPNDLLTWHLIEYGKKNGFRLIDFEMATSKAGIMEFKKNWGKPQTYLSFQKGWFWSHLVRVLETNMKKIKNYLSGINF